MAQQSRQLSIPYYLSLIVKGDDRESQIPRKTERWWKRWRVDLPGNKKLECEHSYHCEQWLLAYSLGSLLVDWVMFDGSLALTFHFPLYSKKDMETSQFVQETYYTSVIFLSHFCVATLHALGRSIPPSQISHHFVFRPHCENLLKILALSSAIHEGYW